jgi:ribosome-associated heat shock protein Hsp15
MDDVRLDKWLWAARFYKTRSLAVDEIAKGRVCVNGQPAKPARALRVTDEVEVRREGVVRTVIVRGLSNVRGPAPVAQALYEGRRQRRRRENRPRGPLRRRPVAGHRAGRPTSATAASWRTGTAGAPRPRAPRGIALAAPVDSAPRPPEPHPAASRA